MPRTLKYTLIFAPDVSPDLQIYSQPHMQISLSARIVKAVANEAQQPIFDPHLRARFVERNAGTPKKHRKTALLTPRRLAPSDQQKLALSTARLMSQTHITCLHLHRVAKTMT